MPQLHGAHAPAGKDESPLRPQPPALGGGELLGKDKALHALFAQRRDARGVEEVEARARKQRHAAFAAVFERKRAFGIDAVETRQIRFEHPEVRIQHKCREIE